MNQSEDQAPETPSAFLWYLVGGVAILAALIFWYMSGAKPIAQTSSVSEISSDY
jgi:hypothetical protein